MISNDLRRALKSIGKSMPENLTDSRTRRLRNYALAIVSELVRDIESGAIAPRELVFVFTACALFVEQTYQKGEPSK